MSQVQTAPRRRGRPAASFFSPAEVASMLLLSEVVLYSLLEKSAASFFPGARKNEQGEWRIPERDVRKLIGPDLPKQCTVAECAEYLRCSVDRVYLLIRLGVIAGKKVLGQMLIPCSCLLTLPAELPACVPARPSFSRKTPKSEEVNQ